MKKFLTAHGAIMEKHRGRVTPRVCYGCWHAYHDVEEGWNCRKYDATIRLSGGKTLSWPGQACDTAYEECKGKGFEKSLIPGFIRRFL